MGERTWELRAVVVVGHVVIARPVEVIIIIQLLLFLFMGQDLQDLITSSTSSEESTSSWSNVELPGSGC